MRLSSHGCPKARTNGRNLKSSRNRREQPLRTQFCLSQAPASCGCSTPRKLLIMDRLTLRSSIVRPMTMGGVGRVVPLYSRSQAPLIDSVSWCPAMNGFSPCTTLPGPTRITIRPSKFPRTTVIAGRTVLFPGQTDLCSQISLKSLLVTSRYFFVVVLPTGSTPAIPRMDVLGRPLNLPRYRTTIHRFRWRA